eukprot:460991-Pyramimonas_sp.AAC.1
MRSRHGGGTCWPAEGGAAEAAIARDGVHPADRGTSGSIQKAESRTCEGGASSQLGRAASEASLTSDASARGQKHHGPNPMEVEAIGEQAKA